MSTLTRTTVNQYWKYALWLALFTIIYNFAEGFVSIYFGAHDENSYPFWLRHQLIH